MLVARVHGAGPVAVVWRHVLPAVPGQLVVLATLDLGSVVLAVAGLSFLGLGGSRPWRNGGDASDGRITFVQQPLVMIAPGFCIFWTCSRQTSWATPCGTSSTRPGGATGDGGAG